MLRTALAILAVLPFALASTPVVSACHAGAWSYGPDAPIEIVGVGPNAVGVYTRDATWQEDPTQSNGCEDQSWYRRCGGFGGTFWTGPVVVPEVRILGVPVVSETPVHGGLTLPHGAPSAGDFVTCAALPSHVGVYTQGILVVSAGTDDLLP